MLGGFGCDFWCTQYAIKPWWGLQSDRVSKECAALLDASEKERKRLAEQMCALQDEAAKRAEEDEARVIRDAAEKQANEAREREAAVREEQVAVRISQVEQQVKSLCVHHHAYPHMYTHARTSLFVCLSIRLSLHVYTFNHLYACTHYVKACSQAYFDIFSFVTLHLFSYAIEPLLISTVQQGMFSY